VVDTVRQDTRSALGRQVGRSASPLISLKKTRILAALLRSANQEARGTPSKTTSVGLSASSICGSSNAAIRRSSVRSQRMPSAPTGADWLVQLQRIGPISSSPIQRPGAGAIHRVIRPQPHAGLRRSRAAMRSTSRFSIRPSRCLRREAICCRPRSTKPPGTESCRPPSRLSKVGSSVSVRWNRRRLRLPQVDFATPVLGWQRLNKAFDLTYPKNAGARRRLRLQRGLVRNREAAALAGEGVLPSADCRRRCFMTVLISWTSSFLTRSSRFCRATKLVTDAQLKALA